MGYDFGSTQPGGGITGGLNAASAFGQGYLNTLASIRNYNIQRMQQQQMMQYHQALGGAAIQRAQNGTDRNTNQAAQWQALDSQNNLKNGTTEFGQAYRDVQGLPVELQRARLAPIRDQYKLPYAVPGDDLSGSAPASAPPAPSYDLGPAPTVQPNIGVGQGAGLGIPPPAMPPQSALPPMPVAPPPPQTMGAIPLSPYKQAQVNRLSVSTNNLGDTGDIKFNNEVGLLPVQQQPQFVQNYNQRNGTNYPVPVFVPDSSRQNPVPFVNTPVPAHWDNQYTPNGLQASTIGKNNAVTDYTAGPKTNLTNSQTNVNTARVPLITAQTNLTNTINSDKPALDKNLMGYRDTTGTAATVNSTNGTKRTGFMGQELTDKEAGGMFTKSGKTGGLTSDEQIKAQHQITTLWTVPKPFYNNITSKWQQPPPLALTPAGRQESIQLHAKLGQNPDGSPMAPVQNSSNPIVQKATTIANSLIGTTMGENGCARAVCAIAKQSGIPIPDTESAADMEKQMTGKGWQKVPLPQAQVVFSSGQGPSGRHVEWHVGNGVTVGDPGKSSNYKVSQGKLPTSDPTATGWTYMGTPKPVTTASAVNPAMSLTPAQMQAEYTKRFHK